MAGGDSQKERQDYLVKLTAARIEEYLETAEEANTIDVPGLGNIVDELNDAARYVLERVDRDKVYRFAKTHNSGEIVSDADKKCTFYKLPNDYLRFIRIELTGWKRPVTNYLSEESPEYQNQQHKWLRGTINRPIAFLVPYFSQHDFASNQALECYPIGDIKELVYVPILKAVQMPPYLDAAMIWKACSAVLMSMRYVGLSDLALKESERYIKSYNTGGVNEQA